MNRREFVKGVSAAASVRFAKGKPGSDRRQVSVVLDPADELTTAEPVRRAAQELAQSLEEHGVHTAVRNSAGNAKTGDFVIVAGGSDSTGAAKMLRVLHATTPALPESFAIEPVRLGTQDGVMAFGKDTRGLVYALLELSDRVRYSTNSFTALAGSASETPANKVRSVTRMFTSDVEDKPWYKDRAMWPHYLTMLATQRFNRFHLALGIGYDFIRQVDDAYFLFPYPFFLQPPGYNVRAAPLADGERDANLAMLQFISEQTVARGMEFQLGLWMHGFEWIDSPHANYRIEGLTKETHGDYCRAAVRLLLQKCPAISGVTFRVHGESGVEEGSYNFWKAVFEGVATCGRTVRLDMHSKGMDQSMLDLAVGTKLPVTLSPKFWAEHMGMPYHQADIRELEQPKPDKKVSALMKLSEGSRSFLRYGYGDLLREDRPWEVIHRIWPGTQRMLLWGDPESAAAYSRAFQFCGSAGVDWCEPLSFKGRRGSGLSGGRCAYANRDLQPRWDWEKYLYTYRIWGRLLYDPNANPDCWRRYLRHEFGSAAEHLEPALANASRILPTVTTAHGPSAANNSYWPELYFNQSLTDAEHYAPYSDSPTPRVFGNVSPFDPQLFSRINDFADQLLSGEMDGKYSPVEVAQWIEDYSAEALAGLKRASSVAGKSMRPEYRRLIVDISLQAGLGNFFAAKFRAALLYRVYEKTGNQAALSACVEQYAKARGAWAELSEQAKGVYREDITVGPQAQLRGHWLDRLPAIDRDVARLREKLTGAKATDDSTIRQILEKPKRWNVAAAHVPPEHFRAAQTLDLTLRLEEAATAVHLWYRHVNQAERYQKVEMIAANGAFQATIPASYMDSQFPLAYYFEVRERTGKVGLFPGFPRHQMGAPYFVVRRLR